MGMVEAMTDRPGELLVVTTAHPPNDKRVYHKFVHSFLAEGWNVSWVGPRPLHDWDGGLDSRIKYIWAHPIGNRVDRVLSQWRVGRVARKIDLSPDWILCPNPDSISIGLDLRKKLGAKVIFDLQEVYHATHVEHLVKSSKVHVVNSLIERHIERSAASADLTVAVSRGVIDAYVKGLSNGVMMRNCPPRWFAGSEGPATYTPNSDFRVMHGLVGSNRGTREIISALGAYAGNYGRIILSCFGELGTLEKIAPAGLDFVGKSGDARLIIDLMDPVPYETMPDHLRDCRAGIVSYTGMMAGPNLANRLFEYMALGVPVLAPVQSPEIVEVVRSTRSGLVYDLAQPSSLLGAIEDLQGDPSLCRELGQNGRRAFLEEYTWESQFQHLLERMR
jgi:glycosyltransferase involved in cell wall biosynthesis